MKIPPPPEHGIHQWLPSAARHLRFAGYSENRAIAWLKNWEPRLRRPYQPNEVENAVALVYGTEPRRRSRKHKGHTPSANKKPELDPAILARLAAGMPEADEEWFRRRSPIDPESLSPATYLHSLTNTGERILCFRKFKSQGQIVWQNQGDLCLPHMELEQWRHGLEDGAWLLPQPVTGEWLDLERLKTARKSSGRTRRSQENVTCFRYALLESDEADAGQWLSALAQLPLPIASIVTSGGKSIHALVLVNAATKAAWDDLVRGQLLPIVARLGADPAALTAVRLTRLPFIHRGSRLQRLLFLNSDPKPQPIADLPPLR